MSEVVIGSFSTIKETIACVEQLTAEGHPTDSIKIITANQSSSVIQEQTGVEIAKVSKEQEDEKISWKKFKALFVDTDDNLALETYGIDHSSAAQYNESLKKGEYIVLANESNQTTTHSTASTGVVGQAGQGVREIRNASEATNGGTFANNGDERLNNAEVPVETNFTKQENLDEDLEIKSDLTDTTVPETIQEGNAMEESIREGEKPRLQDNQGDNFSSGAFSKEQDRREDTRDLVRPQIDPMKHQEYDPTNNPLQGTPPDNSLSHNEPSETRSPNQEELDLPTFDGSTLAGQPRNNPKRDFPNR